MLTNERLLQIAQRHTVAGMLRAVEREARREALEEAAKVCDEMRGPIEIYNKQYPPMLDAATAIRALIEKEPRTC